MDYILIIVGVIFVAMVLGFWFVFGQLNAINEFLMETTDLLQRTFTQYYKTENIEPRLVNGGYDLVWNPNNENIDSKNGFITIWTSESHVDSPILDIKDADILGSEVIKVVEKHIQDRELNRR